MRTLDTLPADQLATLFLADGRKAPGCWHASSIGHKRRMYSARIGVWADRDQRTGAVTWKELHPSYMTRVDCDGLSVVGWEPLAVDYVDPWSGQKVAA